MNLISTTFEDVNKRTTQLMVRFSIGLLKYEYKNVECYLEDGLKKKNEYMNFLSKRFIEQTGVN